MILDGTKLGRTIVLRMMRFLNSYLCDRTFLVKSLASSYQTKTFLHFHLKPSKSNQTLKDHLKSNKPIRALSLFRNLLRQNPSSVDSFSLLLVLQVSTRQPSSFGAKQIHTLVIKLGFESVIQLQSSLVSSYSAAGNLADACQAFDEMRGRNVVCWTALIKAYVENQRPGKAIRLFRQMLAEGLEVDEVTATVALTACADLGALETGEWIHSCVRDKKRFKMDLNLENALINMYLKCGDVERARRMFQKMKRKDVTTWTSMIVGHALHGQSEEALYLFKKMNAQSKGPRDKSSSLIVPNDVTFIGVLMACSHAGLVEEGKNLFRSMTEEYNLKPRDAHFGCMVDIFCRAGLLKEAYDFILKMPLKPNAVVWRTLLGACSLYGNIELGEEVQRKLFELEPDYVGDYVALSNIYAGKGMWDEKINVRDRIKKRRVPGKSSIEVGNGVSEFVSGDDMHPEMGEIRGVLKCLIDCMRSYSYGYGCSLE